MILWHPGSYPEPTGVPSTANKYAQDLACLAISDKNKKYLLGYGCVALLRRVLDQHYDDQVSRASLLPLITIVIAKGGARLAALRRPDRRARLEALRHQG